jgi:hypothetical protein
MSAGLSRVIKSVQPTLVGYNLLKLIEIKPQPPTPGSLYIRQL